MTAPQLRGVLRVIATPLGNIGDLSPRAREALQSADCIAAEDTRRTGILLTLLGLPKRPLVSYFAGRGERSSSSILGRMGEGQTVVLVTDGGTPGISDPGGHLLRQAYERGFRVEVFPGPTAVGMAISVSSLSGGPFVFEGFLPSQPAKRRRRLTELTEDIRPCVLFEAPHRIRECLEDLAEIFGPSRRLTLVREGTKLHEEIREATVAEILAQLPEKALGEFTLVVEGCASPSTRVPVEAADLVRFAESFGLSKESAARRVAESFGLPRSRLLRSVQGDAPPAPGESPDD